MLHITKNYWLFTIFVLLTLSLSAQKDELRSVRSVGTYELDMINGVVTPEEAVEKAKRQAIENAIREVSPLQVSIIETLIVSNDGDMFISRANMVTKGQVVKIANEKCTTKVLDGKKIVYQYTLDAKVRITDSDPDYSYKATVEPDKKECFDGDRLQSIKVNVTKDSYVNLFQINKYNNATLLSRKYVKANKDVNILSGNILRLTKETKDKREPLYFAAVFTKNDILFDEKEDADLQMWMNNIPTDKVCYVVFCIELKAKQ